eukprot:1171207-Pleurochrysis_carterae.AAC.1
MGSAGNAVHADDGQQGGQCAAETPLFAWLKKSRLTRFHAVIKSLYGNLEELKFALNEEPLVITECLWNALLAYHRENSAERAQLVDLQKLTWALKELNYKVPNLKQEIIDGFLQMAAAAASFSRGYGFSKHVLLGRHAAAGLSHLMRPSSGASCNVHSTSAPTPNATMTGGSNVSIMNYSDLVLRY